MATEPGYGEPFRDKPPDCWCRYPWKLLDTGTEHATDCPAHERICRERAATAPPATPFPVGSKVRFGNCPEAKTKGLVLGVAGDQRWVQVGRNGSFVYRVSMLHPDEPEPDPTADVAAFAAGVAGWVAAAANRRAATLTIGGDIMTCVLTEWYGDDDGEEFVVEFPRGTSAEAIRAAVGRATGRGGERSR